jgi:hypothetical protein
MATSLDTLMKTLATVFCVFAVLSLLSGGIILVFMPPILLVAMALLATGCALIIGGQALIRRIDPGCKPLPAPVALAAATAAGATVAIIVQTGMAMTQRMSIFDDSGFWGICMVLTVWLLNIMAIAVAWPQRVFLSSRNVIRVSTIEIIAVSFGLPWTFG